MPQLPNTLEEAIAQSREATLAALSDGYSRLLVELVFPELKAMPVAEQFLPIFEEMGEGLKVFFPDTGAAALARRDWKESPFKIEDLGSSRSPVAKKVEPNDRLFLLIEPSAVEIGQVEQLCQAAGDRPVILLMPRLEDAAVVGIGYAARQLRDRFLSTLHTAYYIRPLSEAALFRYHPSPWQVWLETNNEHKLIAELHEKPAGEALERILMGESGDSTETNNTNNAPKPKNPGLMKGLQRFLRALSN